MKINKYLTATLGCIFGILGTIWVAAYVTHITPDGQAWYMMPTSMTAAVIVVLFVIFGLVAFEKYMNS